MDKANIERCSDRFRKVLDFIDAHLDEPLTLARLSEVAAFSKFHFHRQFAASLGMSVQRYIRLRRLMRASSQLAFRPHRSILDIALSNGYEGPESFARAFKQCFGQSPSAFRKQPRWAAWHDASRRLIGIRNSYMQSDKRVAPVKIVNFPETKVAVYEHRGDPSLLGESVRRFIAWRKRHGLAPSVSATFNLLYHDPDEVAPDDYRFDLCAAVEQDVADNPFGVIGKTIPAGRCAVLRQIGSDDALAGAIAYLYSDWLAQSAEEPRDFPIFIQRLSFSPDVREGQAVTDIFLPLKTPAIEA